MNTDAGHEQVEHAADLQIRAWAPDLRGLIEQAARGLISLLVEGNPAPERYVEIRGEGDDAEQTLVDCLREILLLKELRGMLPVTVDVSSADERSVACRVGVIPLEAGRGIEGADVKAVTYHNLRIRRENDRLVVDVVFDV